MKYVERPREVEAIQLSWDNFREFARENYFGTVSQDDTKVFTVVVRNGIGDGHWRASAGDWVVKDIFGKFTVIAEDTFPRLYQVKDSWPKIW